MDYSEWASPTFYVKKKNYKIRASADFSMGLNNCLETYNSSQPSPGYLFAKLSVGKVFSKLDLSEVYLQIPVNEECVKYLTMNSKKVCIDSTDCHSE